MAINKPMSPGVRAFSIHLHPGSKTELVLGDRGVTAGGGLTFGATALRNLCCGT